MWNVVVTFGAISTKSDAVYVIIVMEPVLFAERLAANVVGLASFRIRHGTSSVWNSELLRVAIENRKEAAMLTVSIFSLLFFG